VSRRAAVDGKLAGLAHAVNGACDAIADMNDRFYGVPARLLDCGTRIQAAAEQVSRDAGRQAEELEAAAAGVGGAADVFAGAGAAARAAAAAAREIEGDVRDGSSAGAAVETLARLQKSIRATSAKLKRLGERSMQQTGLAGLADRMAADANLIALNAAIEAARVGESSSGFAPIADDLARLAERAEAARDEITRAVDALRGEVNETLASAERTVEHLERHGAHVTAAEQCTANVQARAQQCSARLDELGVVLEPAAQRAAAASRAVGAASDSALRMRAAAESVHAHSQTLVAIAADLPAAPGESVLEGADGADAGEERETPPRLGAVRM
jgi:methyl-accepting chemotaxis protein